MANRPESVRFCVDIVQLRNMVSAAAFVDCANVSPGRAKAGFALISTKICSIQALMLLVSIVGLISGCATVQGERYTHLDLPHNLIAGVRENPQTIDLTRLGSATTNSDVLDRGDVVEVTITAGLE